MYATWIVVVVFAPVLLMGGVQGRLFAPLGYAYVLATLSSLVVALTLTPVLSVLLLQKQLPTHEPPLLNVMQRIYERFLRGVIRHRILAIITSLVALSCVIYQSTKFGGEFLPELRESHLIVHMQSLAGTSLEQNVRTGQQLTKELLEDANVSNVCHLAGRAEQGEDTWGIEYGEIEVPLKDGADVDAMRQQLLAELPNKFPGNNFLAFTFLAECIHDSLSGSVAPILVKVKGPDARASDELVERISQIVRETRGSHGVFVESQDGQPECIVRIRHADAARFGLRPAEIVEAVHTAYQGAIVGQVYDRNRVSSICVVLSPRIRQRPDLVEQLWLTVPTERRIAPTTKPNPLRDSSTIDEGRVQLRQVADVFMSSGRFLVTHENGIRTRSITCDTINRDVESFANELEKRLHQIPLPAGMHIEITGEHIAKKSTQSDLFLTGSAAAVGVVLLLWMAVRSYLATMLVLVNVPFSLIGGLLSVYFMGGIIDVGALVGFVTLFGISMRNSIMMVTHLQQLSVELPKLDNVSLIVLGARERLGPILMTALVTGLGLLPIAVGSDEAGREIEGPMAIVIFGGLVSSTFLNLLLLPSIASIFLS
ncbi:MAG: efflux RND transporter permease subunit, partial [Planctomycetes bacterium]|nr:efflux RND transporter permease subunit [Planctomycetota bacterium]